MRERERERENIERERKEYIRERDRYHARSLVDLFETLFQDVEEYDPNLRLGEMVQGRPVGN